MTNHTYRDAGVDIDLEAQAIKALIQQLTYRREGAYQMHGGVDHFAGLIEFGEHVLALAVVVVGTKMLVADELQDWTTVGIDCIAMNVNDLYVMNIEPVAFVDYIAADSLSTEKMAQIGVGLNTGAGRANINIIGGETATLKGLVHGLDLAGTCLGIQKKEKIISGDAIRPGDCIIGIPSSGIHSNGLTLARTLVDRYASYHARLPNQKTLGEELLTPTRIYHEVLEVTARCEIHGMCHITGGGLLNLNRLGNHGYRIDDPLPVHPIFEWIGMSGNVDPNEMYRTFNMGMGFVFIAPKQSAEGVQELVPDAKIVGEVTNKPGIWLNDKEIL
jgi:phosphoribosylformylglycinamidine cyclo-ligase